MNNRSSLKTGTEMWTWNWFAMPIPKGYFELKAKAILVQGSKVEGTSHIHSFFKT